MNITIRRKGWLIKYLQVPRHIRNQFHSEKWASLQHVPAYSSAERKIFKSSRIPYILIFEGKPPLHQMHILQESTQLIFSKKNHERKYFQSRFQNSRKDKTEFINTSSLTLQKNRIWPKNQNGSVLVCWHSLKKIRQTGWIEQQKFILHSSRGKFKVLSGLMSVRPLFQACWKPPSYTVLTSFLCVHAEKERDLWWLFLFF